MTPTFFIISEDGCWGEECIEPSTTLTDTGVDVIVATPTGGVLVAGEHSVDSGEVGEEFAERVTEVHENDGRLQSPKPIARVDVDEYDAVMFPGGRGTARDVDQGRHARQILPQAAAGDDSKAFIVCHAVDIFGFAREAGGSFLVGGREVTGSPNK